VQEELRHNREEGAASSKSLREEVGATIKGMSDSVEKRVNEMRGVVDARLQQIQEESGKKLDAMRETVEEKLQGTLEKRLGESFQQVSERLEAVHKGLGEMQTIATGVGDLKKVLSNVKTRGVLGEYQLGNILEEILTPEQYSKNVSTKKGSQAHVEYAIKLPGKNTDEAVWMPVDSKFPIESYEVLLQAYEAGDPSRIETAGRNLVRAVEGFAKDISEKYLDPPYTTDFGIMFLPVESLYAEVLRHPGLFENLRRNHNITVTGPTTLSAVLNSLHMGFRTLAVQKRSSEVWKVLAAVKSEFGLFGEHLRRVRKQLDTATGTLDKLQTTRTNVMERKLRTVDTLESGESKEILEIPLDSPEADDEPNDE
jgi:DNA recombination protein RmuC